MAIDDRAGCLGFRGRDGLFRGSGRRCSNLEPGDAARSSPIPRARSSSRSRSSATTASLEVYTGYRVQYNFARGPAKGGIRYHPGRHARRSHRARVLDDVEVRGRRPAVRRRQGRRHLRSRASSRRGELERITRRYAAELVEVVGPDKDVPAPDVGTTPQIMAWFMDTYSMHMRTSVRRASLPASRSRSAVRAGRVEATGRGVSLVALEELQASRHRDRRRARRRARVRQRRLDRGEDVCRARLQGRSASPTSAAATSTRTASTSTGAIAYAQEHHSLDGYRGGEHVTQRAAARDASATCWFRRRSKKCSPPRTRSASTRS